MCVGIGSGVTLIKVTCTASSFLCAYGEHGFCMDWILRLSLRSAYGVHNFLENTKFQECVWSAWILVCKWSPGSAFGVRTFQQKKMWECVGVRRSALKDSQVRLECALLTHCYALQTHFLTAREVQQPIDSHSFRSMSTGPPIHRIGLFHNLSLEVQGQDHSSRSHIGFNILSTHIFFVPIPEMQPFY